MHIKKLFLLSLAALIFAACETETPEPEVENRGVIIGTCGGIDFAGENYKEGYFVLINPDSTTKTYDSYLAFDLELPYPIEVKPGPWLITEVALPYDFTYRVINPGDEEYQEFIPDATTTDHWTPFPPMDSIKQVVIYPKK